MFHARKHQSVYPETSILLIVEPVSLLEDPVILDYVGQRLALAPSHTHVSYMVDVHPINMDRKSEFCFLELLCYLKACQIPRNLRRFLNNEKLRNTIDLKEKQEASDDLQV